VAVGVTSMLVLKSRAKKAAAEQPAAASPRPEPVPVTD
jgi:hypothetical protein